MSSTTTHLAFALIFISGCAKTTAAPAAEPAPESTVTLTRLLSRVCSGEGAFVADGVLMVRGIGEAEITHGPDLAKAVAEQTARTSLEKILDTYFSLLDQDGLIFPPGLFTSDGSLVIANAQRNELRPAYEEVLASTVAAATRLGPLVVPGEPRAIAALEIEFDVFARAIETRLAPIIDDSEEYQRAVHEAIEELKQKMRDPDFLAKSAR